MKQTAEHIFRETLAAIDIPATLERKLARIGSSGEVSQMAAGFAEAIRRFVHFAARRPELNQIMMHEATADSRASVYRMAAGGSPAMDPKFPCLSIRTCRRFQSWAIRTRVG